MKKLFSILILIVGMSCSSETKSEYVSVERGDVVITKINYDKHDYLVFRGSDYFSAVVHSASCRYCDSLKLNR